KMSSFSSSTSSLSGSTSSAPDGSGRTFTPTFTGQFGSVSPLYNPDGSIKGIYDLQGNFYVHGGSRNSVLGASPTLVNATSSRAPPPSSMGNMAGGVSVSRSLNSGRGVLSQGILQQQGTFMSIVNHMCICMLTGPPQVYTMPGRSYPTAGGHPQAHVQGMSSQSSVSSMNDMNSNYTSPSQLGSNADYHQMNLHHKEVMMQSQQSSMGRHGGVYFGGAPLPHYPPQLQHVQAVSSSGISSQTGALRSVNAATGYDQPLQHHQNTSQYCGQMLPAIGQPIRDVGSQPTHAAATQSAPDPFSMLGLLSVLNKTNPDVTTLALGMDLQTLGLDMTSKEDLFKTFASPWANEPLKDVPDEFTLPQCYNAEQHPPPHQWMFRKLTLDTLFYIFYSMPKDEAQLYAADELYNRNWFYHKEHKCWYFRIGEPIVKTDAYEKGSYMCFDPEEFESVQKDNVVIYYEMVEKRTFIHQYRM
ncbi:probable NOT transcription complex subunit VIP2, partial [Raphanus sativus]|uniref:Probable NOT transcription complex subunit VIP2 n=1 Tax=Raphanus sativus TaxID=3726 RepID=A0A9W3CA33_RAPSA